MEGFEAPARAWETEILPARLKDYEPSWLDAQCLAGRSVWARLTPPAGAADRASPVSAVGATPIALLERRHAGLWMSLAPANGAAGPSPRAQVVLDCLLAQGALFFDELVVAARLLRSEVEIALAELVALGLVTSDSFAGLARPAGAVGPAKASCRRETARPGAAFRHRERRPLGDRPARQTKAASQRPADEAIEHVALTPSAALRRRVLASPGARGGMAAAMARSVARLPAARGARRDSRRSFRRRLLRRAICLAGSDRPYAGDSPAAGFGPMGVALRRGSAQSRRRPDAGPQARGARRQSPHLSRRPAGRGAFRRQDCNFSPIAATATNGRLRSGLCDRPREDCLPNSPDRRSLRMIRVDQRRLSRSQTRVTGERS